MPTYGYRCSDCEHEFEVTQRITADPLTECPQCKGTVKRMIFPVGIAFKGSGFHINDYRSKSATTAPAEPKETPTPKEPAAKETTADTVNKATEKVETK